MKRNKQKQMRKMAAAALALSMLVGSPAYAADPITSSSTSAVGGLVLSFADVSATHWAIKHITKLASLGIIQGYERQEYRPENTVSQQEVIVMALRMMGLESEALKSKADTVLPVSVDTFFKPYIAYAFERGLIDRQEEIADTTNKTAWGAREASREWVAKLVIRALGKQNLANQQATVGSTFNDATEMSSWANGYVNAAVQLQIVQGMDGNTFQPKGKVTRAQMATFLSRADKHLTTRSDRVTIGYLMGQTDRKISVLNAKGETKDYAITSDTVVYNAKDDTRIPLSSIKLTNEIYVVQNLGNALYIELTNDQQQLETNEGTLNEIYLDQMIVSIQQGTQKKLFEIAQNVTVTDNEGRGLSIGSIAPGSIIALQRVTLLKDPKITQIIVKQAPVTKTAEGTVLSINADQNQITFLEKSGQNETYSTKNGVTVTQSSGNFIDLSKLRVGDSVTYDVKANVLTAIKITKQADFGETVQGKLISLSDDKQIMTITRSGGTALEAYYIASNALVTIEGMSSASLYDLEVGDELKLDLLNNKVINTTVTSRSVKQYTFASILSYDNESKVLTITTDSGSVAAFKMEDKTIIRYGDSTLPMNSFQTLFVKNTKVDLKISKDKIVQIANTTKIEGTVAQLNAQMGEITIRSLSGQNLSFKGGSSTPVETLDKTGATMADLKVGDTVVLVISSGAQEYVSSIATKKVGVYKTLVTNPSTRQLSVKDENGTLLTFVIDNNDKIVNPGKATHNFEDIGLDEYVKATFNGTKLDQLVLLNTVRGKVTSMDVSLGTLTIQDFQGGIQVLPVGQQFTIKQNGSISSALSSLKPDDRVEIIKDVNDKSIIQVAKPSKRTISSYDTVLNQLYLKPTANNDKTTYNFFAKAYLHKGTQSVAASAFVENEEVTIYVLDDKIIEIEKK